MDLIHLSKDCSGQYMCDVTVIYNPNTFQEICVIYVIWQFVF